LQVVEIIDRYDEACVPSNMTENKLAYIQNETISKECIRNLTVIDFHGIDLPFEILRHRRRKSAIN